MNEKKMLRYNDDNDLIQMACISPQTANLSHHDTVPCTNDNVTSSASSNLSGTAFFFFVNRTLNPHPLIY